MTLILVSFFVCLFHIIYKHFNVFEQKKNEKKKDISLHDQANTLRHYYKTGEIMTHYLKSSIKAPKTFVSHPPNPSSMIESSDTSNISWSKCLLRIVGMSQVYSIIGYENSKERKLAHDLWGNKCKYPYF